MSGGSNNNFTPWGGYWPPGQVQPRPRHGDRITMNPMFPHPFSFPANSNIRDERWSPSALASFGGTSHSPLRIIILDNIARDVNQRPRRTFPESPQRFISQSPMLVPTATQDESIMTQEEQKDVLKKLKKEIYNPTPKRIIQRLNLYYRDNGRNDSNDKGKEIVYDEEDKRCAVCLDDFEPKEVVLLTPCSHMFHEDCIVPWVKSHGKCPVCRFAICERLKESTPLLSNNGDAANLTANDPLTGALVSFIRTIDEARGVSTRGPNSPLWF